MSGARLRPLLLGPEERHLFSMLHTPPGTPVAGVLVCPPFFHEHVRSYRLFALLGAALAAQGVAVLRFDYYGTGDSGGLDSDFSLTGACADAKQALDALRNHAGDVPIIILGVRAGAMPAIRVSANRDICALWLWQPVLDGSGYVAALLRQDQMERHRRLGKRNPKPDGALMGFPCSEALLEELRAERALPRLNDLNLPITVLDPGTSGTDIGNTGHVSLAPSLHGWINQVDLQRVPGAPVRDLARQLVDLPELRRHGRNSRTRT